MMKQSSLLLSRVLSVILLWWVHNLGLSNGLALDRFAPSRRTWCHRVAAAVLTEKMIIPLSHPSNAAASIDETSSRLQYQFQPPSSDRPQIGLPTQTLQDEPLVQGLIYYKNPRAERPSPDSVVVITVTKTSEPDTILLAAQVPLASQRLPLQFRFPQQRNGIVLSPSEDLIVRANVCAPENVNRSTKSCTTGTILLSGSGMAKALQFPVPDNSSQNISLRAGVSIALE